MNNLLLQVYAAGHAEGCYVSSLANKNTDELSQLRITQPLSFDETVEQLSRTGIMSHMITIPTKNDMLDAVKELLEDRISYIDSTNAGQHIYSPDALKYTLKEDDLLEDEKNELKRLFNIAKHFNFFMLK